MPDLEYKSYEAYPTKSKTVKTMADALGKKLTMKKKSEWEEVVDKRCEKRKVAKKAAQQGIQFTESRTFLREASFTKKSIANNLMNRLSTKSKEETAGR